VRPSGIIGCALAAIAGLFPPSSRADDPPPTEIVLKGGLLVDGTGAPARPADVLIRGDRIAAIGKVEVPQGATLVDCRGLVVAPGFIDLHTHSDGPILRPNTRNNLNYLRQGVTTIVTGNCGSGPTDAARYFASIREAGAGTNVIHLIPQGSLRRSVLGNADARPTEAQLRRMEQVVEREMDAGAWGMSSGLIYVPSRYASTAELIALAKVVGEHGGLYASHIRGEGDTLIEAVDEAIRIGREAGTPVHISHLKASGRPNWGKVDEACAHIEAARQSGQAVTADQYPYVASSTSLSAMVIPDWAVRGSADDFARIAADPEQGPRLRESIERGLKTRDGGTSIRIARYAPKPDRVGRSLADIAREEGTTPLEVVLDIQSHGGAQAISFGMSEDDVRLVMARPYVATASDGSAHAPSGDDKPHPRAYGTFPRKIRYALDDKVLTLEQAIHSCSGLPASILGLPDRGTIRPGAHADLVVFDPETFRDAATFDDPTQYAPGVAHLFVNGVPAIAAEKPSGKLAGRVLTPKTDGPADLILKVGRIWTGDDANPWAEALAARDGALVAVGKADEVMAFKGPKTTVLDRPGDFATPGLIDAHGHITSLGSSVDELDLRGIASPEEVARRVKERIAAQPGEGWITGDHWDQSLWPGMEFPTAKVLDEVAPDRPVWLRRVDGHAGWANSEAMRRAGITRETQPPSDGQILRDADGDPTGVFVDGAMGLVGRVIPGPSDEAIARRILAAQDACLDVGLTAVHDAGVSRREAEVFRRLDKEGKLKLRVYGMASPPSGEEVATVSAEPIPRKPDSRFEMRAIKLFIDGAMGSRGALLFEPYSDDPHNVGLKLIDEDVLAKTTEAALRHGWQVCTHAIGDKGNALVLDAYARALAAVPSAKDARLRVEHAQVVRKEDLGRFKALGVIASMQPSHAGTDKRWADARLGADSDRVQGAYAWRWFLDAGVPVAFGSDFPVEIPSPFWGLYAALTRQDAEGQPAGGWHPDQILTLEEGLRGFTQGSAFAAFEEDRLGMLRVGMRADVTVVDRDLFRVEPKDVLDAKVTATIIDGEVVHGAEP
jgi:predicted amidohydrolase YtcJ